MSSGINGPDQNRIELETAEGLAKILKLSPFTIRRLGYRGLIREFRCGRAVRYRLDEILNWMEKHRNSDNHPCVSSTEIIREGSVK